MPMYTVQEGDHLSAIAEKFGFRDFKTIWDDPQNADLKQSRTDAHILNPGDQLFIPDKQQKKAPASTGKATYFQVPAQSLELRLVLKDFDEQPAPGLACELEVEGAVQKLVSDDSGMIKAKIPRKAQTGTLRIPDLDLEMPLKIGHLDPPDQDHGWQARLINLGFYDGAVGSTDQERLGYAIEEFQCDHGLPVTGQLDDGTRAALLAAHGS